MRAGAQWALGRHDSRAGTTEAAESSPAFSYRNSTPSSATSSLPDRMYPHKS